MRLLMLVIFFFVGSSLFAQKNVNTILFGRGIYPGDDTTYDQMRQSKFSTMMLSSFYIKSNGDVFSGDDGRQPIIHDGKYTGDKEWLKRVASLRMKGSIRRIEILLEGRWYNQPPNTYDFIRDWADSAKGAPGTVGGTASGSTLYGILKVFRETIGADAICIDDESVYDSLSIIRLGELAQRIGLHMTLCPFTKIHYWKSVLDASRPGLIDAIYLQCYDGGKDEAPGNWVRGLATTVPVYPIFLCRGSFATCGVSHNSKSPDEIRAQMQQFRTGDPLLHGGGVWQMADIKDYVRQRCAITDPTSGNAGTVQQYLDQLRNSLLETAGKK